MGESRQNCSRGARGCGRGALGKWAITLELVLWGVEVPKEEQSLGEFLQGDHAVPVSVEQVHDAQNKRVPCQLRERLKRRDRHPLPVLGQLHEPGEGRAAIT
jgi:hypothetical protein